MDTGRKKRIAFVGQPEYFRIHYDDMLNSDEFECIEIPIDIGRTETFSPLIGEEFDYIFFFRGEFCPKGVMDNCKGIKVAISSEPMPKIIDGVFHCSQELRDRFNIFNRIRDLPFDYIFHYDKTSIGWLRSEGLDIDGEFYLPMSVYENYLCEPEPRYDVLFFGRSTPHREEVLGPLKRGYRVLHVCHGFDSWQIHDAVRESRIVLNLNTEYIPSLNPRLQQSLMSNALVVSEPNSHHSMLVPGVDYIEVPHNEIVEKVEELLKEPIRLSGKKTVLNKLSCVKCWKELMERIEDDNKSR